MTVRLQREDFDVGAELDALRAETPGIGALVSFTGLVRDMDGTVLSMELEHYPGMAEKALAGIEAEARRRWPLDACLIVHRFGRLRPREQIMMVATGSAHRGAAFAAAEFLMDFLKSRAPFWKREATADSSRWVQAQVRDEEALDRWWPTGDAVAADGPLHHLEDLAVGQTFTSAPLPVTAAAIKAFARQFDPQPFHLDETAAADSFFGELVASGWHTAALTMRMLTDGGLPLAGGAIGAGGELRWPAPTRPGDILTVQSTIEAIRPSRTRPDRGMVTVRSETRNQHGEVVQSMVSQVLAFRRPAGGL